MEIFLNKLKEFLDVNGVAWHSIEHRITKMDNNQEKGIVEFNYLVRIPYLPLVKNDAVKGT